MENEARIQEYSRAVQQLLIDNVNAGLETLSLDEIHHVPVAAWEGSNGKLVAGVLESFRDRLKPETLIELDAIQF
ncbi:hypothetical protein [Mucilaginibacter sp. HD30]